MYRWPEFFGENLGEIGGFDGHSRSDIVLRARISVVVSAPDTKESVWNHFPSMVAR